MPSRQAARLAPVAARKWAGKGPAPKDCCQAAMGEAAETPLVQDVVNGAKATAYL